MRPRRYQLRKDAVAIVERGHPWIFRAQLSSAAEVFADGDWLRLVDGANRVVGHGIYEAEGAIAIRIVRRGPEPPDGSWLRDQLAAAISRRAALIERTDGIRLVNGESDGLPAIAIDRFGDHVVVASYAAGADAIARYLARALAAEAERADLDDLDDLDDDLDAIGAADDDFDDLDELHDLVIHEPSGPAPRASAEPGDDDVEDNADQPAQDPGDRSGPIDRATLDDDASGPVDRAELSDLGLDEPALEADLAALIGPAFSITVRSGRRRQHGGVTPPPRAIRGRAPDVARFVEYGITYAVDLAAGHKTGAYLDLRALRRDLAASREAGGLAGGARVLNLFAYTGMLARAAEAGGAISITSVDASARALAFAAEYHVVDRGRHKFVEADVFDWIPRLADEPFDIVIVDPPSMTSSKAKVPAALAAYRKLYRAVAKHVRPGGALVAACCTSRIERTEFHRVVSESLGHRFKKTRELTPEPDHPVGFPQADYLKIAWWRRTG